MITLELWRNVETGRAERLAVVSCAATLQPEETPEFVFFALPSSFIVDSSVHADASYTLVISAASDVNWHYMTGADPTVVPVGTYGKATTLFESMMSGVWSTELVSFPGILLGGVKLICSPTRSPAISFSRSSSRSRTRSRR